MVCCSFREEQISLQVQVEKVMNLYKSLLWKMVYTVRFILNYLFQSIHCNPSMFSKAFIVISWPWESTSLPSGRSWVHTPARPTTRVFKKTGEVMLAAIWDLVSVQMIASMGDDIKQLALSPSSFFHWSNQGGHKRASTTVRKEHFPGGLVYPPCITHRSYHGLWVGYSKLKSGLIAAASGALVCWCLSLYIM